MPWAVNPAHLQNKQTEEMEESNERKDAVAGKPSAWLYTSREKGVGTNQLNRGLIIDQVELRLGVTRTEVAVCGNNLMELHVSFFFHFYYHHLITTIWSALDFLNSLRSFPSSALGFPNILSFPFE